MDALHLILKMFFASLCFCAFAFNFSEHNQIEVRGKMDFESAKDKLEKIGQEHLLRYWDKLSQNDKEQLLTQISSLDIKTFQIQQKLLQNQQKDNFEHIEPFQDFEPAGSAADRKTGFELIKAGKVGCLLIAGGQGTRLRINGPKGLFPISPIKHKSLFQIFAEKVVAASKQAGCLLPLAIMTSPLNHEETVRFFKSHGNFGLKDEQLSFFFQKMLPLLDKNGNLFLEEQGKISFGPDGNGSSLKSFVESGIWDNWNQRGIKSLNYVLVDNPLADPYDTELVGFHQRNGGEVIIKCILRNDPFEKLGVLAQDQGKICVVEYSEIPKDKQTATKKDGKLLFPCGSISLFSFDMNFVKLAASNSHKMPLHSAFKASAYVDEAGLPHQSKQPNAWKFETFIFDCLPFAKRVKALTFSREDCFAPLKNFEGNDSPEQVQKALLQQAKKIFSKVTGKNPPSYPFELSQEFYYPTPDLISRWKEKNTPTDPSNNYFD
jgi:UDP-N-acetylglucosamine/UDP-N-acetylgalactosamine diphosphorylase